MPLKHLLFISAYVLASTTAAVNFYGSGCPDGDYVTCEVPDASDEEVSAALGMFYFSSEIVPESNDLQLDEPLVCGDLASAVVEFVCNDMGGDSTCIPTQPDTDSDSTGAGADTTNTGSGATGDEAEAVSERSLAHLDKRAGAVCEGLTSLCKNQYQSTTGTCADGYEETDYEAEGQDAETWCRKPCTDEEKQVCKDQRCSPQSKKQCDSSGDPRYCADALALCAGSPVKMAEAVCDTKYMSQLFNKFCGDGDRVGAGVEVCVSYDADACTLNDNQYKAFGAELDKKVKISAGLSAVGIFGDYGLDS